MDKINLITNGGAGDMLLSLRLTHLINQIYPNKYEITNICAAREETFNILKTITNNKSFKLVKIPEDSLNSIKNEESLNNFDKNAANYLVWPDKLFRGIGRFPLEKFNISNFLVKQSRCLLGDWKPNGYISVHLNSITPGYTYHSISELVNKLSKTFPDKKIYVPILTEWNGKSVNYPLINSRDNIIVDENPTFDKVYKILCESDYSVTTDNGILHILHDIGAPYLLLDPRYNAPAFEARWRPFGYFNSVDIKSLVDDILNVIRVQIQTPETCLISSSNLYRQDEWWNEKLIFKE